MIPWSMKSSVDVQVEFLSDDKLKNRRKKASGATLITACLSQPCLTVGDNHSSPTASRWSIASIGVSNKGFSTDIRVFLVFRKGFLASGQETKSSSSRRAGEDTDQESALRRQQVLPALCKHLGECEAPAPELAREDAEQRIGGSQ